MVGIGACGVQPVPPPSPPTPPPTYPSLARNYIHVMRHWGPARAAQHIPEFARRIVGEYDKEGAVSKRAAMKAPHPSAPAKGR